MAKEYKGEQNEAHAAQGGVDDCIVIACLEEGILQSRPVATGSITTNLLYFVQAR